MPDEFSAEESAALEAMKSDAPMEVVETPEATETVAPTPEPEFKGEGVEKPKPPEGYVPHGAMHEAREQAKAAKAEAEALRAELAALKAPKAAEGEGEMPDPILDPKGFATWLREQTAQPVKTIEEMREQQRQTAQQQERIVAANRMEAEFAAKTADYSPAMEHLIAGRKAELALQGWNDEQAAEIMRHDANAIFDNAQRMGRNPAEMLYELAKHRGFGAKPAPQADEGAKIVALAKAAEATASLATTAGEAQEGGLTMKQLAEMSEEDLAALDPKALKKVMGG